MNAKQIYDEYVLVCKQGGDGAGMDYLDTLTPDEYKALMESLTVVWQASYLKLEDSNGNKMGRTQENLAHS